MLVASGLGALEPQIIQLVRSEVGSEHCFERFTELAYLRDPIGVVFLDRSAQFIEYGSLGRGELLQALLTR